MPMRLSRKKVTEEARALVNEGGLEALTTRRLGERLGVKGPALYRHFKSKQDIVTAIGRTFFTDLSVPKPDESWESWLQKTARASRKRVLSCRDGAKIIAMAKPDLSGRMDKLLMPLINAGFTRHQAIYASHLIGRFVIGWTSAEQEFGGRVPPFDAEADPEVAFEFALQAIIAGLQVTLMAHRMQGTAPAEGDRKAASAE